MKLVEILARELNEWPEDAIRITQEVDGFTMIEYPSYIQAEGACQVSEDRHSAFVTRAQWEAERARILLESQPERDADVAKVVDGVVARSAEDQALWDKVAIAAIPSFYHEYMIDYRSGSAFLYSEMMEDVAECADAFMAERAKRMKGAQ